MQSITTLSNCFCFPWLHLCSTWFHPIRDSGLERGKRSWGNIFCARAKGEGQSISRWRGCLAQIQDAEVSQKGDGDVHSRQDLMVSNPRYLKPLGQNPQQSFKPIPFNVGAGTKHSRAWDCVPTHVATLGYVKKLYCMRSLLLMPSCHTMTM